MCSQLHWVIRIVNYVKFGSSVLNSLSVIGSVSKRERACLFYLYCLALFRPIRFGLKNFAYVYNVFRFFKIRKMWLLHIFELLHTFSRTLVMTTCIACFWPENFNKTSLANVTKSNTSNIYTMLTNITTYNVSIPIYATNMLIFARVTLCYHVIICELVFVCVSVCLSVTNCYWNATQIDLGCRLPSTNPTLCFK